MNKTQKEIWETLKELQIAGKDALQRAEIRVRDGDQCNHFFMEENKGFLRGAHHYMYLINKHSKEIKTILKSNDT